MRYAFIKENTCVNIAVFDGPEQANAFKEVFVRDGFIDDLVLMEDESQFGIGDNYENGIWIKQEYEQEVIPQQPTETEQRLIDLEMAMAAIMGGEL
nr:MAG TPA: hypothetical protein [Caudoviricetes sp.]